LTVIILPLIPGNSKNFKIDVFSQTHKRLGNIPSKITLTCEIIAEDIYPLLDFRVEILIMGKGIKK